MVGLTILIVFVLYVSIALFAIVVVKGNKNKAIVLLMFILIPTADVIIGKIYFNYLCSTQSGQFIYKTVELGDDYLYESGEFMMHKLIDGGQNYAIAKGGEINRVKLRERYDFSFSKHEDYSSYFHITKVQRDMKDKKTNISLSTSISYIYAGGWVENIYQPSGIECSEDQKHTSSKYIHSTLFDKTFFVGFK